MAPSIASAKLLTTTSAEIAFVEPVDNASVQAKLNSADFTIEGQQVTAATPKADGKTYTITWATPLDKGALVEVVISYKGFKDNYGNTVAEAKTFKFAASDDAVAPTVTDVTVNADNTLELTFSEDVVNFGAADLELYDKDNKKLSNVVTPAGKLINSVTSKKVYTLTITGGTSLSGAHSLKVLKDGVTDLSVRGNKNAEQSFAVTLNDKVAPQVSKAEFVNETTGVDFNTDSDEKDSKITIFFNEAMDASTLTNKANFLLGGVPVSEVAGASLTAAADNKSVTLTVNKGASDTQVTFLTSTDLRVLAVKDAAGNTLDTAQLNKDLGSNDLGLIAQFASAPALTTAVSTVEAVAKNQLKLTAATGYTFASIDPNKIKFNENQSGTDLIPGLQVMSVSIAADGKSAVLTLNNNLSADRKYDGTDADTTANNVSLYADADAIVLGNGAKTAALVATSAVVAADKIAPSLVPVDGKLDATAATVAVAFDEAVSAASNAAAAQALTVKDSKGNLLLPGTDYTAGVSGSTITLTFATASFNDTVSVALANNNAIVDGNGNLANNFAAVVTDEAVVVPAPDTTAPTAPVLANLSITDATSPAVDTISGAAGAVEANATVNVYSDAGLTTLVGTATAAADGSFGAINLTDETTGTITYYVVAVDAASNASTATSISYTAAQ